MVYVSFRKKPGPISQKSFTAIPLHMYNDIDIANYWFFKPTGLVPRKPGPIHSKSLNAITSACYNDSGACKLLTFQANRY